MMKMTEMIVTKVDSRSVKARAHHQQGVALVISLLLMVVLTTVIGLMFTTTLSELKQSRASTQYAQAKALAEAGGVYAQHFVMQKTDGPLEMIAQNALDPFKNSFEALNHNPATELIVPNYEWNTLSSTIEGQLNAGYNTFSDSELDALGTVSLNYEIDNFRLKSQSITGQVYVADYQVVSEAIIGNGTARRRVEEGGVVSVLIGRLPLSHYAYLVDDAKGDISINASNDTLFTGPVHANHNWGFLDNPVFEGRVTTADPGVYYWATCLGTWERSDMIAAESWPPCTAPDYQAGIEFGTDIIDPAESKVSQAKAAIGLDPEDLGPPLTSAALCYIVFECNGGIAETSGDDDDGDDCDDDGDASDCLGGIGTLNQGVYLMNNGIDVTGGIYVEGDLDSLELDGQNTDQQIYRLTRAGQTTTITADYSTGRTTVELPSGTITDYNGVPNDKPTSGGGINGQVYVNGVINSLSGPPRTGTVAIDAPAHPAPTEIPPALARQTQLNVTAKGLVNITGDLIYQEDPTLSPNPVPAVLGVVSLEDNIIIDQSAPTVLYLWGAYLTVSQDKGMVIENYSTKLPPGFVHMFGSKVTDVTQSWGTLGMSGPTAGYSLKAEYDERFMDGRVAPPNFPVTAKFQVGAPSALPLTFREF